MASLYPLYWVLITSAFAERSLLQSKHITQQFPTDCIGFPPPVPNGEYPGCFASRTPTGGSCTLQCKFGFIEQSGLNPQLYCMAGQWDSSAGFSCEKVVGKIVEVVAGQDHSVALLDNSTLITFGHNQFEQLGDDRVYDFSARINPIKNIHSPIVKVAAGSYHNILALQDNTIITWGDNRYQQLGDSDASSRNPRIDPFGTLSAKVKLLACGNRHTLIVLEDNTLITFGLNLEGQLGDNDLNNNSPRINPVQGLSAPIRQVVAGGYHNILLLEDNTLITFGSNTMFQAGHGDRTVYKPMFNPINTITTPIKLVAAGTYHTVVLLQNNTLISFGSNTYKQLGDNSTTSTIADVRYNPIKGLTSPIRMIACGGYYTVLVLEDNSIVTFGSNLYNPLATLTQSHIVQTYGNAYWKGLSNTNHFGPIFNPVNRTMTSPVRLFSAARNGNHNILTLENNTLITFGWNDNHQLGDAHTANYSARVNPIPGIPIIGSHCLRVPSDYIEGISWSGCNGTEHEKNCTVPCTANFTGTATVKCVSGKWVTPIGHCAATCDVNGVPANAHYIGCSANPPQSNCTLTCKSGYVYNGLIANCVNGSWEGNWTCEAPLVQPQPTVAFPPPSPSGSSAPSVPTAPTTVPTLGASPTYPAIGPTSPSAPSSSGCPEDQKPKDCQIYLCKNQKWTVYSAMGDGTECDDGVKSTYFDTCTDGKCIGVNPTERPYSVSPDMSDCTATTVKCEQYNSLPAVACQDMIMECVAKKYSPKAARWYCTTLLRSVSDKQTHLFATTDYRLQLHCLTEGQITESGVVSSSRCRVPDDDQYVYSLPVYRSLSTKGVAHLQQSTTTAHRIPVKTVSISTVVSSGSSSRGRTFEMPSAATLDDVRDKLEQVGHAGEVLDLLHQRLPQAPLDDVRHALIDIHTLTKMFDFEQILQGIADEDNKGHAKSQQTKSRDAPTYNYTKSSYPLLLTRFSEGQRITFFLLELLTATTTDAYRTLEDIRSTFPNPALQHMFSISEALLDLPVGHLLTPGRPINETTQRASQVIQIKKHCRPTTQSDQLLATWTCNKYTGQWTADDITHIHNGNGPTCKPLTCQYMETKCNFESNNWPANTRCEATKSWAWMCREKYWSTCPEKFTADYCDNEMLKGCSPTSFSCAWYGCRTDADCNRDDGGKCVQQPSRGHGWICQCPLHRTGAHCEIGAASGGGLVMLPTRGSGYHMPIWPILVGVGLIVCMIGCGCIALLTFRRAKAPSFQQQQVPIIVTTVNPLLADKDVDEEYGDSDENVDSNNSSGHTDNYNEYGYDDDQSGWSGEHASATTSE